MRSKQLLFSCTVLEQNGERGGVCCRNIYWNEMPFCVLYFKQRRWRFVFLKRVLITRSRRSTPRVPLPTEDKTKNLPLSKTKFN